MLANCQANLRRWEMDANLFPGNAERLPSTMPASMLCFTRRHQLL